MNLKERIGTNYYAKIEREDGYDLVHLGKACYELRFAFRWNPKYYEDFEGFKKFVNNHSIINHFGRSVDPKFLIESIIMKKHKEASIANAYQKVGKRDLVHITKEAYEDTFTKNKFIAEHHFVNEDFGIK